MGDIKEIGFISAYSTRVESTLRATLSDRDDEAVKDHAADDAERSQFDSTAVDCKATLREKQVDRSFDSEFNRHSAAMRQMNRTRPPNVDTSDFRLVDWTCQCCAKSFRTLRVKEFCTDKCGEKGPTISPSPDKVHELICQYGGCGKTFRSKRFDARFCPGGACQKAARRAELSRTTLREAA
jgi:hypothetical protein